MRREDELVDDPIMAEKLRAQREFAEAQLRAHQSTTEVNHPETAEMTQARHAFEGARAKAQADFAKSSKHEAAPTCNETLLRFANSIHASGEAKEAGTRMSVRSLCEVMRGNLNAVVGPDDKSYRGYEVLSAIVDSGASVPVFPPKTAKAYKLVESEGSRRGARYELADSSELECLGKR